MVMVTIRGSFLAESSFLETNDTHEFQKTPIHVPYTRLTFCDRLIPCIGKLSPQTHLVASFISLSARFEHGSIVIPIAYNYNREKLIEPRFQGKSSID